jgi:aryl-alcohol dehydrogenase-like predicted oxidoreductase
VTLPASSRFRFTADLTICRTLNGMWQISGAHGHIDPARALEEMFAYHDAGLTTWDLADHYGPEPRRPDLDTASLQKYKNMIDAWGGWTLFQELLAVLKGIADKHGIGIANVGMRYVLDRPAVAGIIIGARLGVAQHIKDNARTFGFTLDADDLARIEAVLAPSRDLMALIGDCGDEYRR